MSHTLTQFRKIVLPNHSLCDIGCVSNHCFKRTYLSELKTWGHWNQTFKHKVKRSDATVSETKDTELRKKHNKIGKIDIGCIFLLMESLSHIKPVEIKHLYYFYIRYSDICSGRCLSTLLWISQSLYPHIFFTLITLPRSRSNWQWRISTLSGCNRTRASNETMSEQSLTKCDGSVRA